ncbi:MAG: sugar phosphate isomerase/epimerase [Planctomycetales bacterium]
MKFGVHSYLLTEQWSDTSLDLLDQAKQLGAEVFEIAVGDDVSLTPRLTRSRTEALGLDLVISPGGVWPVECDIASDLPENRRRGLDWHKQNIELAAKLGAKAYCGALYGHVGVVERRRPPAAEFPRVVEGLGTLAEFGMQQGVEIVIEPMSHFRTHLVNTPPQAMRIISAVAHKNLSVLLDTYHLLTEVRDYKQAILSVADRLWGIHACENDRGVPGGGLIPWHSIAEGLKEINFDGFVMLEAYNSSIGDFAFHRGMFHNVCPEAKPFIRQGFEFLRGILD